MRKTNPFFCLCLTVLFIVALFAGAVQADAQYSPLSPLVYPAVDPTVQPAVDPTATPALGCPPDAPCRVEFLRFLPIVLGE